MALTDLHFHQQKRIRNVDLGDLVEVWADKTVNFQSGYEHKRLEQMQAFAGYITSIDFDKLVLSNVNPFLRTSQENLVKVDESYTEIPYDAIYEVVKLQRTQQQSQ